jgi:hypothetical protein
MLALAEEAVQVLERPDGKPCSVLPPRRRTASSSEQSR